MATVEGSAETSQLRERMVDIENVGNMAEFAIGPNPVAHIFGNLQRTKRLWTVHFAIGKKERLDGDIHHEVVVLDPTIELDGETIYGESRDNLDMIRELSAMLNSWRW